MATGLPFWEDFSSTETTYANPGLWMWGRSVRINDGMAILPPSIRVATFDGIDSVGSPYSVTDVLAKGYADKLVSQSIDLTTVAEADRNSVWLSYNFQMKGNGEIPDAGDRLLVLFLDELGEWVPVDTIENDGSIEPDIFYTSFVQVKDEKYFHEDFKFRIQNFARLSGPYDTWHVDYIYLNKGRTIDDISFPDRTLVEPLTNLFGIYRTVPTDHFKADPAMLTKPYSVGSNMRIGNKQPIFFSAFAKVSYIINGDTTEENETVMNLNDTIETPLEAGKYLQLEGGEVPDLLPYVDLADSIQLDYKYAINTRDNDPNFIEFPGDDVGDYDPAIYAPIDFRSNDTTRTSYFLLNKYAYDDGVAEYGAGLNQPGAQLAYKYTLVGVKKANITALEMYFPRFGDESSQVLELRIWNSLERDPVYTEVVTLQRSEENITWVKKLIPPGVNVDSIFYIGWKQNAAAVIAVGLDKNTDTGDQMYYNTTGGWEQNVLVHGSLILRPVFGELGEVSGLEDEENKLVVYPNPSSGTFFFNGVAEMISVYDMTGRSIPIHTESTATDTRLVLSAPTQGIYIIKAHIDGHIKTAKVLVRQ